MRTSIIRSQPDTRLGPVPRTKSDVSWVTKRRSRNGFTRQDLGIASWTLPARNAALPEGNGHAPPAPRWARVISEVCPTAHILESAAGMRRVLVAIDFGPASRAALERA